jgi:hypothetical protein
MSDPGFLDHLPAGLRPLVAWAVQLIRNFLGQVQNPGEVKIVDIDKHPITSADVEPGVVYTSSAHPQPEHVPPTFVAHLAELGASKRVMDAARSLVDKSPGAGEHS